MKYKKTNGFSEFNNNIRLKDLKKILISFFLYHLISLSRLISIILYNIIFLLFIILYMKIYLMAEIEK